MESIRNFILGIRQTDTDIVQNIRRVIREANVLYTEASEKHVNQVIDLLIDDSIVLYGRACWDVTMGIYNHDLQSDRHPTPSTLSLEQLKNVIALIEADHSTVVTSQVDVSHTLIAIQRSDRDIYGNMYSTIPPHVIRWHYYLKSHDIARKVMQELVKKATSALIELIITYRRTPGAPLAGAGFEHFVNLQICNAAAPFKYITMKADSVSSDAPSFSCAHAYPSFHNESFNFTPRTPVELSLPTSLVKRDKLVIPTLSEHCYYTPYSPNNPLFDAFFFSSEMKAGKMIADLYIVQSTISDTHGGSAEAYNLIDKLYEALKKTHTEVKITYLYVCPKQTSGTKSAIVWRMPGGWNKKFKNTTANYHKGRVVCMPILLVVSFRVIDL